MNAIIKTKIAINLFPDWSDKWPVKIQSNCRLEDRFKSKSNCWLHVVEKHLEMQV